MMDETQANSPLIDPSIIAGAAAEEAAAVDAVVAVETKPLLKKEADMGGFWWGTGRRKSSVARVRIKPGTGILKVNKKEIDEYFTQDQDRIIAVAPMKDAEIGKTFDIFINVGGGGTTGQSGAIRLGIARALIAYDPAFLVKLRDGGHLTRDARMVERKKPGKAGARKSFQFSKR
jgi:small subunit ribosomal protein S9